MNEFCEILKKGMKQQKLTCQKLGEMADVSTMSISYYRSGRILPTIDVADKILKALNSRLILGKKVKNK